MTTSYGSKIPIYCSTSFEWKGKNGTANHSDLITLENHFSSLNFEGVAVKSSKTGEIKYFEPVYDENGYDGEYMVYSCDGQYFVNIWNY